MRPSKRSRAARFRGRWRRDVREIRPSCMRHPTKLRPSLAGRRAFRRFSRLSGRHGRGIRRIRAGTVREEPGRQRHSEPAVVGGDARLQRARHHRRDRAARIGGAAAHRVDRRRRSIDRRHARASAGSAARAGIHAAVAAGECRQGRGAASRIRSRHRRHRRHSGCGPRVFPGGVSGAHRAHLYGARRRGLRLTVPGPAPRVPLHPLPRQSRAHAC